MSHLLAPLKQWFNETATGFKVDVVDRASVAEVEMAWMAPGELVTGACVPPGFDHDDVA